MACSHVFQVQVFGSKVHLVNIRAGTQCQADASGRGETRRTAVLMRKSEPCSEFMIGPAYTNSLEEALLKSMADPPD